VRRSSFSPFGLAYFGLVAVGLLAAAALGLGLAWDGSWLLFGSLDRRTPFVFFLRLVEFPLDLPAIAVAGFTQSMRAIGFAFGLAYFAVPFGALLVTWRVLGRENRRLFVWAALGVGILALPAQIFATSEIVIAVQLTWPLLLAVATRSVARHWLLVVLIGIAVAFTGPIAAGLLLGVAVIAAVLALVGRDGSPDLRPSALFGALAIVAMVASLASGDVAAHSSEVSVDVLVARFHSAIEGWPLISLLATYAAGVLIVGASIARRHLATAAARFEVAAVIASAAAGAALVPWALDVHAWRTALDGRTLLPFIAAPLMGLALVDARVQSPLATTTGAPPDGQVPTGRLGVREWIALEQAVAMVVVLLGVGLGWNGLTTRLGAEMAASPSGCVERASMPWSNDTALGHWSVTAASILRSGRRPTHIVLPACAVNFTRGVHVTPWSLRQYRGGWFDFSLLHRALIAD
jgi:hypothetical protein